MHAAALRSGRTLDAAPIVQPAAGMARACTWVAAAVLGLSLSGCHDRWRNDRRAMGEERPEQAPPEEGARPAEPAAPHDRGAREASPGGESPGGGATPETTTPKHRAKTRHHVARKGAPASTAPSVPFEGTAGLVAKPAPKGAADVLQEVRVGKHAGFDRVVFQFAGDRVPGYRVEYVDQPVRSCGSGRAVAVTGQGFLQIRLTPAAAHDDKGQPTVGERARVSSLPVVRELAMTCDFEGNVTYVVGVAHPNDYRVTELSNPPRLVVDLKH